MLIDDYQLYEAYAALSAPATGVYRIDAGKGARDVYGFNVGQKQQIGLALIDIVRKMHGGALVSATIELDDQRRIVISKWFQAANLYEQLTNSSLMSGMAGKPEKLKSQKNRGCNWH